MEIHHACKTSNPTYVQAEEYVKGLLDAVPYYRDKTIDEIFIPYIVTKRVGREQKNRDLKLPGSPLFYLLPFL